MHCNFQVKFTIISLLQILAILQNLRFWVTSQISYWASMIGNNVCSSFLNIRFNSRLLHYCTKGADPLNGFQKYPNI